MTTVDQLRVFISSVFDEFRDLRDIINSTLRNKGIGPYLFESDGPARPDTNLVASLDPLRQCDAYVGIFAQRLGEITREEFMAAREHGLPMFIYIRDPGASRSKELEEFLCRELYAPQARLTYRHFSSATELAEMISQDLLAWLVREHRELTAASNSGRYGRDQASIMADTAAHLQASTGFLLPPGSPADALARDLRLWVTALGYRIEDDTFRTDSHFEQLLAIPGRRRTERILVHGVAGEAERSDLDRLVKAAQSKDVDELWLLAVRRVSNAAREAGRRILKPAVACLTFDELVDDTADFSQYFAWLDAELQRQNIAELYVTQSCRKPEYDEDGFQLGESYYDANSGGVEAYLDRWLADPAREHLSVLGEFGIGKTWLLLHYAKRLLDRYRVAAAAGVERPRLPLLIPLRDYARAVSAESLFSEFLFRRYEIGFPGYSAFECLNRMGKFALLFDGFDEMSARVDRQKMINHFWELAKVVGPASKAILTCRTEHFPHAAEGRALLEARLAGSTVRLTGKEPQFTVLYLAQFTPEDVRRVLIANSDDETAEFVMSDPRLVDLARRPIMINFILESLPEVRKGLGVDLARIYLYASCRKMERDIRQERTFTSLADKLYFLAEVSTEMLTSSRLSLNYRNFPHTLERLFPWVRDDGPSLDHWQYDMMSQSMLIRSEDGDYAPAHRSLAEFFAAYKIGAMMGALSEDFAAPARAGSHVALNAAPRSQTWSDYYFRDEANPTLPSRPPLDRFAAEPLAVIASVAGRRVLTTPVIEMLAGCCDTNRLVDLLLSTKGMGMDEVGYVGGLVLTLLSQRGADLSGVDLSGCYIRGALCDSVSLVGASLRNAALVSCRLRRVNLSRALLDGAELSGSSFEACEAQGASLEGVQFGPEDFVIRLGNRLESFDSPVTVLDAAARLHREVMYETTGASVNGERRSVDARLEHWDAVWVERTRGGLTISESWRSISNTWAARHHINRFFNAATATLMRQVDASYADWGRYEAFQELLSDLPWHYLAICAGDRDLGLRRVAAGDDALITDVVRHVVDSVQRLDELRRALVDAGITPNPPRSFRRLCNLLAEPYGDRAAEVIRSVVTGQETSESVASQVVARPRTDAREARNGQPGGLSG